MNLPMPRRLSGVMRSPAGGTLMRVSRRCKGPSPYDLLATDSSGGVPRSPSSAYRSARAASRRQATAAAPLSPTLLTPSRRPVQPRPGRHAARLDEKSCRSRWRALDAPSSKRLASTRSTISTDVTARSAAIASIAALISALIKGADACESRPTSFDPERHAATSRRAPANPKSSSNVVDGQAFKRHRHDLADLSAPRRLAGLGIRLRQIPSRIDLGVCLRRQTVAPSLQGLVL